MIFVFRLCTYVMRIFNQVSPQLGLNLKAVPAIVRKRKFLSKNAISKPNDIPIYYY